MNINKTFEPLDMRMRDIGNLRAAAAVLEWDQEVCMPPKGATARGRQLATLNAHAHNLFTAPEMETLIREAADNKDMLNANQKILLHEIIYEHQKSVRLSESLVRRLSEARSAAYHAWLEARRQRNFSLFLPHLETLVNLSREKADR